MKKILGVCSHCQTAGVNVKVHPNISHLADKFPVILSAENFVTADHCIANTLIPCGGAGDIPETVYERKVTAWHGGI